MKIDRKYQLDQIACHSDEQRGPLGYVHVEKGKNGEVLLAVTNGAALVVIGVGNEPTEVGCIPVEVIRQVRRSTTSDHPAAHVEVGEETVTVTGTKLGDPAVIYTRDKMGETFPDWRKVMPKKSKNELRVGIDINLLVKLSKAIGASRVVLVLDAKDPLAPIQVLPHGWDDTDRNVKHSILMPVRVD